MQALMKALFCLRVQEAARFQQWLDTMNSYARTCAANSDCVDPRIDKNYEGDRFQYGEQKI